MRGKVLSLPGVTAAVLPLLSDGVRFRFDGWLSVLVRVAEFALLAAFLRFRSRAMSK